MHNVQGYKRGWVANSSALPKTHPSAAFAHETPSDSCAVPLAPPAAAFAAVSENGTSGFELQADGNWRLALCATDDTNSFADVALDIGKDCLRVKFPGRTAQLLDWPLGTGAEQIDACSARFSKRRHELVITLPSSQTAEDLPVGASPAELSKLSGSEPVVTAVPVPTPARNVEAPILRPTPGPAPVVTPDQCERLLEIGSKDSKFCHETLVPKRFESCQPDASQPSMDKGGAGVLFHAIRKSAAQVENARAAEPNESIDSDSVEPADSIDPKALDIAGIWMLHSAAALGNVKRMQALLVAGVNGDSADESGACPLEKACSGNHLEAVRLLLDHGATPSGVRGSSSTPLHAAVAVGASGRRIVQLLCEKRASRTAKDAAGRTPADLAREIGLEPWPELKN